MTNEPKKMWRCANDMVCYCSGEPEWIDAPRKAVPTYAEIYEDIGGKCKRDPRKCEKHMTFTQTLEARLRKGAGV